MIENQAKLIAYLVEKVTKGVRKQIKGYVSAIKEEVGYEVSQVQRLVDEFDSLYKLSNRVRADFEALELMINESKSQKKLFIDMKNLYEDNANKMMDFNLLKAELQNELIIIKKARQYMKSDGD